jgi:hypothetical protein
MIIKNKFAQMAILICMALIGFLVMRRVIHLNREGMPSVAHLQQVSNDVGRCSNSLPIRFATGVSGHN